MQIATVVGTVVATRKHAALNGAKLLLVQPQTPEGEARGPVLLAIDAAGAGIGERVLVVFGRAARHVIGRSHDIGFQCAVAGIVDRMELNDGRSIGPVRSEDRL
jgi:ethanolamine utilization protein EutN